MSFYLFRLEKINVKHQRGVIPDNDLVSFSVFVNQIDRGHGAGMCPALSTNTSVTTDDNRDDGTPVFPPKIGLNIQSRWTIGPFEVAPGDDLSIVYTGTNTSDSELASLGTQAQDELELKILNIVSKKFVGLVLGAGFGDDIAGAFSAAFDKAFKDPVGDLIGFEKQGPCNGPVFAGAMRFSGSELDHLSFGPVTSTLPGNPPKTVTSSSGIRFTRTHTQSSDTRICHTAETEVTFLVFRVPFISVREWSRVKFPSAFLGGGIRRLAGDRPSFTLKSLLGILP